MCCVETEACSYLCLLYSKQKNRHKGSTSREYAKALNNHGLALGPLHKYEEAERCFLEALSVIEKVSSTGRLEGSF